jgi:hypothetical protein
LPGSPHHLGEDSTMPGIRVVLPRKSSDAARVMSSECFDIAIATMLLTALTFFALFHRKK